MKLSVCIPGLYRIPARMLGRKSVLRVPLLTVARAPFSNALVTANDTFSTRGPRNAAFAKRRFAAFTWASTKPHGARSLCGAARFVRLATSDRRTRSFESAQPTASGDGNVLGGLDPLALVHPCRVWLQPCSWRHGLRGPVQPDRVTSSGACATTCYRLWRP